MSRELIARKEEVAVFAVLGPTAAVAPVARVVAVAVARVAEHVADLQNLINLAMTGKERFEVDELGENGAEGPHIDWVAVVARAEELGCAGVKWTWGSEARVPRPERTSEASCDWPASPVRKSTSRAPIVPAKKIAAVVCSRDPRAPNE